MDTDDLGRLADGTLAYLSATDRELCDIIRRLEAKRAALPPTDPAIHAINAELDERRQDLIFSRRSKGKG